MIFPFIKKIFHDHHNSISSKPSVYSIFRMAETKESDNDNDLEDDVFIEEGDQETRRREQEGEETTVVLENGIIATSEKKLRKKAHNKKFVQSMEKKVKDYVDTLTIHGLTRCVTSKQREALFWTAILLLGSLCACVVIHGLVVKYQSRSIYTELTSKVTKRNYFPSITFCERDLLQDAYFAYCGIPFGKNVTYPSCIDSAEYTNSTTFNRSVIGDDVKKEWSNLRFTVFHCESYGNEKCVDSYHLKSRIDLNNSCFTWNPQGDFYDSYSHVTIKFKFHHPLYNKSRRPHIMALPHDPNVTELELTNKILIDNDHMYYVTIDKTKIHRLEHPFPSNCTRRENNGIFPGRYTTFGCLESYHYKKMYKECGDVFDYHRKYIPRSMKEKYRYRDNKTMELLQCFRNFSVAEKFDNLEDCNFPCEDLDLSYSTSFVTKHENGINMTKNENVFEYVLDVQIRTPNQYKVMTEKQLYTLSQMACEIGGLVGLIMGMSVISIIEVLAIICLYICKKTKGCI